jgi:hypothetical protein
MDTTRDIIAHIKVYLVYENKLLSQSSPPFGRTSSYESRNASIHNPFSQILTYIVLHHNFHFFFLIVLVGSNQVGSLVILGIITGSSGFSFSLESSCSFSCFSLTLGSMEFSIDSLP